MTSQELEALKNDFVQRGGSVQTLPKSKTNGMRSKDWKHATRAEYSLVRHQQALRAEVRCLGSIYGNE